MEAVKSSQLELIWKASNELVPILGHGRDCPQRWRGQGQFISTRHPPPTRTCGFRKGCRAPIRGDNILSNSVFDRHVCRGEPVGNLIVSVVRISGRTLAKGFQWSDWTVKVVSMWKNPPRGSQVTQHLLHTESADFDLGVGPTSQVTVIDYDAVFDPICRGYGGQFSIALLLPMTSATPVRVPAPPPLPSPFFGGGGSCLR